MKWLRKLLFSLIFFVCFWSAVLLAVLIWPQILVNPTTLGWASRILAHQGILVQWEGLDIQIDSQALLRKRFGFEFSNVCVEVLQSELTACAPHFELAFAGSFGRLKPRFTELGPVEIQDLKWKLGKGEGQVSGLVNLHGKERHGEELRGLGRWTFDLLTSVELPDRSQAQARAELQLKGEKLNQLEMDYQIDANYRRKQARAFAQVEGRASFKRIHAKITGKGLGWLDEIPEFQLNHCDIDLSRQKVNHQALLQCPVSIRLPILERVLDGIPMPTQLGAMVQAKLETSSLIPSGDTYLDGPVEVRLEPIQSRLFSGKAEVKGNVKGAIQEFPDRGIENANLLLSLNVFRFEDIVKFLKNGEWPVPAPLHVLKGNAALTVEGSATYQKGKFPFTLATRLDSQAQAFDLDGQGVFFVDHTQDQFVPHLKLDLLLSNVQLVLPRLDWAAPPRLFPDSRFRSFSKAREEENAKPSFYFDITIRTEPSQPAQVLANLASAPIPVALQLNLTESVPIHGQVEVLSFPVEIFRRKAVLKHFQINLKSPTKESPLDGAVQVDYADYKIFIKLSGVVDRPVIHLSSDPPVAENQLIATLLFGQPLDELDPEQSDSVGNTRAAIQEGAINLASLYLLASTPIQSVGYNPETRSVTAKIRLGDGTSLNVGADTGSATPTVGLRRRLGPNWSIETDINSAIGGGGNLNSPNDFRGTASAYLQWSRRY